MKIETIVFEWDEEKEAENYRKHRIHFSTALNVFNDPNRVELFDYRHSTYEERYITIGFVNDIIVVVYTMRGDVIRLISARGANKQETEVYYEYNTLLS